MSSGQRWQQFQDERRRSDNTASSISLTVIEERQFHYLIVIIDERFPIVVALHIPSVVVLVIFHRKVVQTGLFVCSVKGLDPWSAGEFIGLQIDPDETTIVNMDVDREEAVLAFIEAVHNVKTRSFGKVS